MRLRDEDRKKAWQIARSVYRAHPDADRRTLRREVRAEAYGSGMSIFLVHVILPMIVKMIQAWVERKEDAESIPQQMPEQFAAQELEVEYGAIPPELLEEDE